MDDKNAVATHEAGHAIIVLATPFYDYVVRACIFQKNGSWRGEVETNRTRTKVDPHGVYELAKDIAGPLAQLHFHRNSIPLKLRKLIKKYSGLLAAARRNDEQKLNIQVHWWPDLFQWIAFYRNHPKLAGTDYFEVERGVLAFFRDPLGERATLELSRKLLVEQTLDRQALLSYLSQSNLPHLTLPNELRQL